MRTRRRFLFLLAALLGAAIVVLPAVAGSETAPTIEAVNSIYYEEHHWSPSQVIVTAGGVVTLSNPTAVRHGVEWRTGPAVPTCSSGIPVGTTEAAAGANWSGTCTFTTPGIYTFYCTVHHAAMTATITVSPNGATTTTTTSTQPSSSGGTPTSSGPTTTPGSGSEAASGQGASPGSPLAGSASSAVKLSAVQHGKSVRGSVAVSRAGTGGRLEVDLLAKSASLASSHHASLARVGRLVRSSLQAGTVSFAAALNAKARHALTVHRRLALTVRILLSPLHGSAVAVARRVVVHS